MKISSYSGRRDEAGSALVMILTFSLVAGIALVAALSWSNSSTTVAARNNHYYSAMEAADAATEKVLGRIAYDFQNGGQGLVDANMSAYRALLPSTGESSYWADWTFNDGTGNKHQIYVNRDTAMSYTNLNSIYTGLKGFASTYSVVANASPHQTTLDVAAGVRQGFQLATIPIFQFAVFYNLPMEIGCGQPFTITGRVHSNADIHLVPSPGQTLTFNSDVTAVGTISGGVHPCDPNVRSIGTIVYNKRADSRVSQLNLPIGVSNTPGNTQAILEPPPTGEDPNSPLALQRYYNKSQMIVTVTDSGVVATSGRFNNFATSIPVDQANQFIILSSSFRDSREQKTVKVVDIDVGKLKSWTETNTNMRVALGNHPVSSIYIHDVRNLSSSQMKGVRVRNGINLPALGLTVATSQPIYVLGHYNAPNASHRGTTNTSQTLPASLAGDAITILSTAWQDANSTLNMWSYRVAAHTTVNAAFLSGIVSSCTYNRYSGGLENYVRFMETWSGGKTFTYNGSMVVLFYCTYSTARHAATTYYRPPVRNWAFDQNFVDAGRLPPITPGVISTIRGKWQTVRPNTTTVADATY